METVEKQQDIVLNIGIIKYDKYLNSKGRLFEFIPKIEDGDCEESLMSKMNCASNYLIMEFNFEKDDTLKMTVR